MKQKKRMNWGWIIATWMFFLSASFFGFLARSYTTLIILNLLAFVMLYTKEKERCLK